MESVEHHKAACQRRGEEKEEEESHFISLRHFISSGEASQLLRSAFRRQPGVLVTKSGEKSCCVVVISVVLLFAESCVIESFSRFELDHGERFAVSSARSALALPRPRLLCAQVLCRLFPPSFPLLPAA